MIKEITTKSGFSVSVDTDKLDDMELVEALAELNENDIAMPKVATMVLGKEDKCRLYDHLRTEKGNVPVEAFTNEFTEIMELLGAKN